MTSSLLYTNNESSPIEAEFTFPIADSSAVFRFEAEIEGRHIVAEIQEKELVIVFLDCTEDPRYNDTVCYQRFCC